MSFENIPRFGPEIVTLGTLRGSYGTCKRKWYFAPFSFALVMLWQIVPRIEFITTIVLIRFVQKVIRCLTMIDGFVFLERSLVQRLLKFK